jgi:DNA-binding LacI/PurR family transcriptional regulator
MVTIKEISERTGFSIATVSKVLRDRPGVSPSTQEVILTTAKNLGYRPNLNARYLKTGKNQTLGIIAEDLTVFNTPAIIDGIGVCCEQRSYHYILGNLRFNKLFGLDQDNNRRRTELLSDMMEEMLSKQVDGILYVGCHSHAITTLSKHPETRSVCAYCYSDDPDIPDVSYNDQEAARRVAELLIDQGHQRIGVLAGTKDSYHTNSRLLGFQEELFANNIPYNPHHTYFGNWERDQGFALAPALIDDGVTAIFAMNDLMAIGVIDYCNQKGIEVGKDLALIGFDDREIASVCRPTLTTVALPLFDIGHTAASLMLYMIENDERPESHKILLDCHIIERGSTRPAIQEQE